MPVGFVCDPAGGGCGTVQPRKWLGRCAHCFGYFDPKQIFVEERDGDDEEGETVHVNGVREFNRVKAVELTRTSTGFPGFDRILGTDARTGKSGLARTAGHTVQFTGAPGAGKSTLLTQMAHHLTSAEQVRLLYVSGEERIEQAKARADRLKLRFNAKMLMTEDKDLDRIFYKIDEYKPGAVVIDSLQKVRVAEYAIGSPAAAVIAGDDLYELATKKGFALLLVNHVDKAEQAAAGAKAIEHAVDTSLFLKLHSDKKRRILSCKTKNRHGDTPCFQLFHMTSLGLAETESDEEQDEQGADAAAEVSQRRGSRLRRRTP